MTAEPIPFRVLRYRCPTCPRTASSKARMVEHIGRCWLNPEARGCKTCKHFEPQGPENADGCRAGVDLTGRPACTGCGGANWLPTGEIFRPRFAMGGPVYAQCPDCGGDGAEIKPGPIVGCDRWQAAPRCQEPTCPDFGDPDFGEGTCPAEHTHPARLASGETP